MSSLFISALYFCLDHKAHKKHRPWISQRYAESSLNTDLLLNPPSFPYSALWLSTESTPVSSFFVITAPKNTYKPRHFFPPPLFPHLIPTALATWDSSIPLGGQFQLDVGPLGWSFLRHYDSDSFWHLLCILCIKSSPGSGTPETGNSWRLRFSNEWAFCLGARPGSI